MPGIPKAPPIPKRRPRKRRCRNCDQWYLPRVFRKGVGKNKGGGSPQRFCTPACRKEYNRNGSAFGPLRDKVRGLIAREVKKQLTDVVNEIGSLKRLLRGSEDICVL